MMMTVRVAILVLCQASVAALIAGSRMDTLWETFKSQHNKRYGVDEDQVRRQVWQTNVEWIQTHNLEYDLGLHSFYLAVNHLADWTFEEYQKYLLGARPELAQKKDNRLLFKSQRLAPLPDHVDWRQQGYVTPVKDQGQCGSCWTFASTGALEGQHFKKTGVLKSLSEQNLVDCVTASYGCGGGWPDSCFEYVQANGGIDTEESYPYKAKQGTCHYNSSASGSTCSGHVDIPSGDEIALQEAVATIGPIAVGIDATHKTFMFYKSGIYYDSACSHNQTDHAVLVVGYGQENGYDYWLVKNSWARSWGDQGYIKMARNLNDMCAIASHASYPLV